MKGGVWRVVMLGLAVAAAALVFLGVEITQLAADDRTAFTRGLAICGLGLLSVWFVFSRLSRHFRDLGRLSDRLSGARSRIDLEPLSGGRGGELARLAEAASLARGGGNGLADGPLGNGPLGGGRMDRALRAALVLSDDPLLILDEQGRVEQLNPAAARLLAVEEGADIGKSLQRDDLARAMERARGSGAPVTAVLRRTEDGELSARVADLGLSAGTLLSFPARGMAHAAGLSGKRTLSLRPAQLATPLGDEEPLAALPFVALWVATAGEEPDDGPVIAVGTVRLVGSRIFPTVSLTLLIDPVDPVPASATARHGIDTAMVAGERPFAAVWPAIQEALHNCIAVGIGVDLGLAALARSAAQGGIADPALPPSLDLGALAGALDPALAGASPDRLADALALPRHSRKGPQGEALFQAELAVALISRLTDRGIVTQGQARALIAGGGARVSLTHPPQA
ncbi:DNA polymerase III subunit epsilon [Azospirillum sp. TSH100]|uniref:PAS domain-containing protein n=1 Tax=Azospirillum sp. TSH100 TaxID=652764 RepID=UPI000D604490|nr:PAS domain-containing protein [Azospirillum sp. TSH100]PWC81205.1 DNA polymerase III subunit epsilon [Azospirillum sp. TSH100]QCG86438.1 PAS domain-containing protein [Azospirillum sp. TSH100]